MLNYMKRKVREANQAAADKKAELDVRHDRVTDFLKDVETSAQDRAAGIRERAAERAEAVRGSGMQGAREQHRERVVELREKIQARKTRDRTIHQMYMARIHYVYQDDHLIKGTIKGLSAQAAEMSKARKSRQAEWGAMTDAQRQEWVK